MFQNYSSLLFFNKSEALIAASFFILFLFLPFLTRIYLLNDSQAIKVTAETPLYLESDIQVTELNGYLTSSAFFYNQKIFNWAGNLLGWKTLKSGHYIVKKGSYTWDTFLKKLSTGKQDPIKITILPGLTEEKFLEMMANQFKFSNDDLRAQMNDQNYLNQIGISREELLGRMLPETYSMFWTSTPKIFTNHILNQFENLVITPNENRISDNKLTISEIITLASIVELEAYNDEEKPKIAGLYLNRLRKGWRLQADPTVNFALGERRRLIYEDYEINHPYNTYKIKGLPPGPITNPALSSILAVLNPESHRLMYMVATPEGGHDFSFTYEQHLEKSRHWQRWIRQQYRIKREREEAAKK